MKSDSLANKAFTEIRRKILTAQVQPNTRLKEEQWANKLSVSRMAVREALTRLLGEGLVKLGEKGGYYVTAMTEADVHHLRELREILEIGALRLGYKKMTKDNIEKLEKICNDFTAMVKQGYLGGACEADIKFHETLMELSGNEKLIAAYQSSHIPLFQLKVSRAREYMDDFELTDEEHRQLVKALKSKNIALAEQTLIRHFARGESTVLDLD